MKTAKTKPGSKRSTSDQPCAIIICDDHIAIRTGVAAILADHKFSIVGTCESLAQLIKLLRQHKSAVVVTDLAIDGVPFPTLAEILRTNTPDCKIIVYSMRESPATVALCYSSGALAFVPKRSDPQEIVNAVTSAIVSERYIPISIAPNLANYHYANQSSRINLLTKREMEFFLAYAKGDAVADIASQVGLSDGSVQNKLTSVSKKLEIPRQKFREYTEILGLLDI